MTYRRRPRVVHAAQWFPPDDARHDAAATPVTRPNRGGFDDDCGCDRCTDPDHKIADGEIGYDQRGFWLRKDNATVQVLRPGMWIVSGDRHPYGVTALPAEIFEQVYERAD